MAYDSVDPAKTALLLFDMLNGYFRGADEAAQRRMEPVVANCARLLSAAREAGLPVFYAKADHRADGRDSAALYTDTDMLLQPWADPGEPSFRPYRNVAAGDWRSEVIDELKPEPGDYVVAKHRWSTFHQTHLELSLRTKGVDTILLCGGSTHIGIASTAFGARDLDFNLVIVRDCCEDGLEGSQDHWMTRVFPMMARIRTADEVIEMMRS